MVGHWLYMEVMIGYIYGIIVRDTFGGYTRLAATLVWRLYWFGFKDSPFSVPRLFTLVWSYVIQDDGRDPHRRLSAPER